jgi:hypothetical protein
LLNRQNFMRFPLTTYLQSSAYGPALFILDRATITTLAGRIADEEVVAGVEGTGPDKLTKLLPKDFFIQQDALKTRARELAVSAAHGAVDDVMADHFAALAKTCVSCHSVYLRGSSDKSR